MMLLDRQWKIVKTTRQNRICFAGWFRRATAWMLTIAYLAATLAIGPWCTPGQRLALSTFGLLVALKLTILLRRSRADLVQFSGVGLFLYMTIWPGMDPEPFRCRNFARRRIALCRGIRGVIGMSLGLAFIAALGRWGHVLTDAQLGSCGIASLLTTVHLGFAQVLAALLQWGGWPVGILFDRPFASRSLADFWNRRWNRAFVEMDRILFLRPLHKLLGPTGALVGVFVISGLLHEFAISFPAGGGYGSPFAYFVLHGVLVCIERRFVTMNRWPVFVARLWTAFWLLAPVPLLFHEPFRQTLIVPLFRSIQMGVMP